MKTINEILEYQDLLWNLVKRDLVVRYKRSVLGLFWSFLNPIINTVVYTIVFSTIFRFDAEDFIIYFLSGYLAWNFFSQSTALASRCILDNVGLFKKVYIPKAVFVLSIIGSGLINLGFTMLPLVILMLITGKGITVALWFFPVALLFVTAFTLGVSFFLAATTVYFDDIGEMYRMILMPWMFLTPIVYPVSIIPEQYMPVVRANPCYAMVECIRAPIYYGTLPDAYFIIYAAVISVAALAVGWIVFEKLSDGFVYHA